MSSTIYNDVTGFEVCGFIKNRKIYISWELTFSSDKKIYLICIKDYNMAQNNMVLAIFFYDCLVY